MFVRRFCGYLAANYGLHDQALRPRPSCRRGEGGLGWKVFVEWEESRSKSVASSDASMQWVNPKDLEPAIPADQRGIPSANKILVFNKMDDLSSKICSFWLSILAGCTVFSGMITAERFNRSAILSANRYE